MSHYTLENNKEYKLAVSFQNPSLSTNPTAHVLYISHEDRTISLLGIVLFVFWHWGRNVFEHVNASLQILFYMGDAFSEKSQPNKGVFASKIDLRGFSEGLCFGFFIGLARWVDSASKTTSLRSQATCRGHINSRKTWPTPLTRMQMRRLHVFEEEEGEKLTFRLETGFF